MMSSSLKTKNILSKHKVESLVSSGAQKAIKETGQGGEGLAEYKETDGEWGGFRRKSLFPHVSTPRHTFRKLPMSNFAKSTLKSFKLFLEVWGDSLNNTFPLNIALSMRSKKTLVHHFFPDMLMP